MTASQRAVENAKALAASVLPQLQAEYDAIAARVAAATSPAELETLARQYGERIAHLRTRLPAPPQPPPPDAPPL